VEDLLAALKASLEGRCIVAFTGAGISAESGVPTFRGVAGLWKNYSPEKLATAEAFEDDPRLVWEWYEWLRGLIHAAEPSAGHLALAEIERRMPGKFTLVTQNMDGLHERTDSRDVVKLHGDIWRLRCTTCGSEGRNEQVPIGLLPPLCRCGGMLRPAIVWFGEMLPEDQWQRAMGEPGALQHAPR
jgi:NAD-dependent deacetylase